MGRSLRFVPEGYEHPRYDKDDYRGDRAGKIRPCFNGSYVEALGEWFEGRGLWLQGKRRGFGKEKLIVDKEPDEMNMTWEEWTGNTPEPAYYMFYDPPDPSTLTHMMMFETCTEGTPISPIFRRDQEEELAQWLADNNASAFAGEGASKEHWLATIKDGGAVSALLLPGVGIVSGVEGHAILKEKEAKT